MSSPPWDYIAKLVCIGDSGCGKSSLTIRLCEGRFVTHHDVTIGVEFGSRIVPVGPPYSGPHKNTTSAAAPLPPSSSSPSPSSPPPNANGTTTAAAAATATATTSGLPPPPQPPAARQKHMKLSLWDTAGQETYKSVTRSYFRGASGALLVFDLTRRATFQHAIDWLNDLRQIAEPDIVVVLVGNKADLTWSPRGGAEPGAAAGLADTAAATGTGTGRASADGRGGGGGGAGGAGGAATNQREVTRAEAEEWARRNGVLEYVETSAKSGENVERAFMRVAERIFQNIQAGKYDLNDRRSGVKGPSAAAGGVGGSRPVRLTGAAPSSRGGGCC